MNELFSQGGKGSTGILTNKQAVARHFGVKQSDVVYFSPGVPLTGYKVIYDKESQRAYSLPADIGSGVTAVSLSPAGVLVHSASNVDLGALAITREEYVTLSGSFDTGVTVNAKNELVIFTDGKYRWDGELPKEVPAGSTPVSTGGVSNGAWRPIGDLLLRSELATANSGYLVDVSNVKTYPPSGWGSPRTLLSKNRDLLSIKDFGAVGDGVTNDTAAIQAALDYSSSKGVGLFAPSGRYRVDTLILKANTCLYGEYIGNEGKGTSFLGNGVDDVFKGVNSDALFATSGVGATVPYAHHVTLRGFEVDGGVNGVDKAFSTTLTGRGIAIWGSSLNFVDIDVINCGSHGIESAYHDSGEEWALYFRESSFRNVRIRNVGKHGWWFKGPHDAKLIDCSIINASRAADNSYDGFISEIEGSCDIVAMHSSCSGTRSGDFENIRHRYSGNFGGGCHVVGSTFEGARSAAAIIKGAGNYFDSTCSFYAPFGTAAAPNIPLILLSGATGCIIHGTVDGAGYPTNINATGLRFDPANPSYRNYIDLQFTTIATPFSFGSSATVADGDGGDNFINGRAIYYGSNTFGMYGVLNSKAGSSIDLQLIGSSNARTTSRKQSVILTVAAQSTLVWTFKYPFRSASPVVTATMQSPSGAGNVTTGFWISTKGQNSVSIYNGNTNQITLNITAEEPVMA